MEVYEEKKDHKYQECYTLNQRKLRFEKLTFKRGE